MKLLYILIGSIFFGTTCYAQNNCDIRQVKINILEFVLTNNDSVKKYTIGEYINARFEMSENGILHKSQFYIANQNDTVAVWNSLRDFTNEVFSYCPGSHFYNDTEQLETATLKIPLGRQALQASITALKNEPGYISPGAGYREIPKNSTFTIDVRELIVAKTGNKPQKVTAKLNGFKSGMVQVAPQYYFVFRVVHQPENKSVYLAYKLFEVIDYKGRLVTRESWRPIINGKAAITVSGHRDVEAAVTPEDTFTFDILVSFE